MYNEKIKGGNIGVPFIKASVVYFIIGVSMGMYMGITNHFSFTSAHAHINLLGWVSLALAGLIYKLNPAAGTSKMALVHFWLHMIGIPLLTFAMVLFGMGQFEIGGPISGIGGILVISGVVVFAVNVFKHVKR
ncbi:MAG: cytochrome-c oxidase [Brevibacillus sp.]|nr:cytochrome-c oxidase [Brevibacillus sp.]